MTKNRQKQQSNFVGTSHNRDGLFAGKNFDANVPKNVLKNLIRKSEEAGEQYNDSNKSLNCNSR